MSAAAGTATYVGATAIKIESCLGGMDISGDDYAKDANAVAWEQYHDLTL